jgi:phosphate starvation-inducible protein PhoH and related proteins
LTKRSAKPRRRNSRFEESAEIIPLPKPKHLPERNPPPIRPFNAAQADYLDALRSHAQVIALGPAGTGKTWIAAAYAADLYRSGQISRVILTRPNAPCGRSLGFFPGSLDDKFAPWAAPVLDALRERMGGAAFDIARKNGAIELAPFEVMRGRSWRNAFVLLDEAQNATAAQMKMFLTRIGEDCQVVVNGDAGQSDIKETSGLAVVLDLVKRYGLPAPVIEFGHSDIVRSEICAMWARAFNEAGI